jgi:hypothetical protein
MRSKYGTVEDKVCIVRVSSSEQECCNVLYSSIILCINSLIEK